MIQVVYDVTPHKLLSTCTYKFTWCNILWGWIFSNTTAGNSIHTRL